MSKGDQEYLSERASTELFSLLRYSLLIGLIGPDTFQERLSSLRLLLRPDHSVWRTAEQILRIDEFPRNEDEDWYQVPDGDLPGKEGRRRNRGTLRFDDTDDDGPLVMYFVPSLFTGLHDWEFHKGDADPYPTVPHGHQGSRVKLDPYRGFIYQCGRQTGRASRKSTVRLWNDPAFRIFAREAIEHFVAVNPHLSVSTKLPERRRGYWVR